MSYEIDREVDRIKYIAALRSEIGAACELVKKERDLLAAELAALQDRYDELLCAYKDVQASEDELREEIGGLIDQRNTLQPQLAEAQRENARLREQIEHLTCKKETQCEKQS